jgi:phosphatidylglycerol---prolipoprotein diacylglyceryl transferase
MLSQGFQIGGLNIHWYGVLIACGVIMAITIAYLEAKRRHETADHLITAAFFVVPLGLIGARLYHVIDQWSYYMQHPGQIVGTQGLGIYGAVIGGAIGLIIYCVWKRLSILRWFDIIAPGLILAQAIGRWGNFFNQELYGYPTDLPWGIYIDPAHRSAEFVAFDRFHPLFFYEFTWNILGFVLMFVLGRRLQKYLRDGDIFFFYLVWYGAGRFFLEGLKPDVWAVGGIPMARLLAALAMAVGVAMIAYRHYRKRKTGAIGKPV